MLAIIYGVKKGAGRLLEVVAAVEYGEGMFYLMFLFFLRNRIASPIHKPGCYLFVFSTLKTSFSALFLCVFPAFNLFFQICLKSVNLRLSNYFFYGL